MSLISYAENRFTYSVKDQQELLSKWHKNMATKTRHATKKTHVRAFTGPHAQLSDALKTKYMYCSESCTCIWYNKRFSNAIEAM